MSIVLSISSVLSFISFLTTVLALIRVGSAAFTYSQAAQHDQVQSLPFKFGGENGLSLSEVIRIGINTEREKERKAAAEQGGMRMGGYLVGADHPRVSLMGGLAPPRKAGTLLRPRKSLVYAYL